LIELILDAFTYLPVIERDWLAGKGELVRELERTEEVALSLSLDFRKNDEAIFWLVGALKGIEQDHFSL
jgi:hypothetical protein